MAGEALHFPKLEQGVKAALCWQHLVGQALDFPKEGQGLKQALQG